MKSRRRRNRRDHLQERLLNTCAWCGALIPEDTEVFSLSAKLKPGVDLKKDEGTVMPLTLELIHKVVLAIVPRADSPAKKEGKDVLFMICSDDCGTALREALNQVVGLVEDIQSR
jgi:hypothetical protein